MEVNVVEDSKAKFIFEVNEGHAFCNALKDELWNDSHVKIAAYRRDHPLINVSRFLVETDGKIDSKSVIQKAIQRLTTKNKNMKGQLSKALK